MYYPELQQKPNYMHGTAPLRVFCFNLCSYLEDYLIPDENIFSLGNLNFYDNILHIIIYM